MEELDLKQLLNIFWKSKIQIILIVAIFIAIGVIYTTSFVTPVYTASTTLVLATADNKNNNSSSEKTTSSEQSSESITTTDVTLVSTYSELVKSKNVLRQVLSNLNIKDLQEESLRGNVTVSSVKDTELIEISVTNVEPIRAKDIANEIAKVFSDKVGEIYNINNVHVVDEAEVPSNPSNINHVKDVLIFAIVGFVISIVYVLIANMLDTTIKSVDELEQTMKVAVLVSIPVYNPENDRKGRYV